VGREAARLSFGRNPPADAPIMVAVASRNIFISSIRSHEVSYLLYSVEPLSIFGSTNWILSFAFGGFSNGDSSMKRGFNSGFESPRLHSSQHNRLIINRTQQNERAASVMELVTDTERCYLAWRSSRRIFRRCCHRQADNCKGYDCRSSGGWQDVGESKPDGWPEHDETAWCHSRVIATMRERTQPA
jgi:hypothetical protein